MEREDQTRDDIPTGLPSEIEEGAPGGLDEEPNPDGEGTTPRGEDAMPGIPKRDEPFTGG
jgi:hypothetical protein